MALSVSASRAHAAHCVRRVAVRVGWGGATCLLGWGLAACGDDASLRQAPPESYRVVAGIPRDEVTPPRVETVPGASPLRPSRPHRCDTFLQESRRKVDVLWVVDSSASMADEQEKLALYFANTMDEMADADPPTDFHLGVITTDVDRVDEERGLGPGWLRQPAGAAEPWVACAPEAGQLRCNVGDGSPQAAKEAFAQLVRVGTGVGESPGSPQEKGLLAASLALSEPLRSERNAGFLRDDAALNVVFIADEDDSSCGPYIDTPPCLASPSCKCEDSPAWGSVDDFTRFFRGLKGYGNEASVRIGAIVATEEDVLDFPDDTGRTYVGCTSDASVSCAVAGGDGADCAFHAPRYAALAGSTGGAAVSICAAEYASGLVELGLSASGLHSEFALARTPVVDTIDVRVVPNQHDLCDDAAACPEEFPDCINRTCVRKMQRGLPEGWEHVICLGGTQRNVVRFSGRSIPEPLHTIEVCYDVDVGADVSQCQ